MNFVVNLTLLGILYVLYLWSPWVSLVIASLSSVAFSYQLFFDKEYVDEITPTAADRLSIIFGFFISFLGVIASVANLL